METNFAFISTEFPEIFAEAKEAEKFVFTQPRFSALQSRITIEKAVLWLYENEADLDLPYDTGLGALMANFEFKNLLTHNMIGELHIVRKVGNKGAHGDKVRAIEALSSLKYTFRFLSWISKFYSEDNPEIPPFDEQLIPKGQEEDKTKRELKRLAKELEKYRKENEKHLKHQQILEAESVELRRKTEEKEKKYTERKKKREKQYQSSIVVPSLTSEQETRRQLIDLLLFEAGWKNLREGVDLEYEVTGMPITTNPSGKGYVDYVLWGDNGKPLAVVEAKSTLHEPSKGKHQAFLYAECLEKMTGQRPVIFYSNGYENYIWDDLFYPPRKVSGFYTKEELQTLITRRGEHLDLRKFKVNTAIAGRPYQMQAIQAVAETFTGEENNKIVGKHRKALLVMATGSGKTRVSAAIVDMLTRYNWVKRVLFLADRNALVTQAKNSFKEQLPQLSAIDLTKEKGDGTARIVFSTYPTMMNLIDDSKIDGEKRFGIGHFDLIIIDEAHRSIYQKYQAIFEYFDALLVGLTATPIRHRDRNTYELFGIEDENPTFAYELEQAVKEGYLVPPVAVNVPLKFPREGIKYDELSEKDKLKLEEVYGIGGIEDEGGLVIPKSEVNEFLFNNDTIDKVLDLLFEQGLKIESGDKIGKTIIFAKNHKHAVFIAERFYKNYPEYGGDFLEVIDNYNDKAEDLLERFKYDKGEEKKPQIAVSVDMMDTGVDAPRVLNLIFFKEVKSAAKFWQMIGRGTRLCPNIFGAGEKTENHKQNFYIFDICGNFEYFNEFPKGKTAPTPKSLNQLLFEAQLEVIYLVNSNADSTEEERNFALDYTEQLYKKIKELDETRFAVRKHWEYVKKYKQRKEWNDLTQGKMEEMKLHLGKLIAYTEDTDELAKKFDLLIYRLELSTILQSSNQTKYIDEIHQIGERLLKRINIPSVKRKENLLRTIQIPAFWNDISLYRLEKLRIELRDLIQYLRGDKRVPIYTSILDELDPKKVEEIKIKGMNLGLHNYKARIEDFIKKNKNHLVIDKIYKNIPITNAELIVLEDFLTHEKFDLSGIEANYKTKSLGLFVRRILGMDMQAAQQHFADFIQEEDLTNNQIQFINKIIEYLNHNGIIDKNMLTNAPFTSVNDGGILGVFEETGKMMKVVHLIEKLEDNIRGA